MRNENINLYLAFKHIFHVFVLIMHMESLTSLINLELYVSHNPWNK